MTPDGAGSPAPLPAGARVLIVGAGMAGLAVAAQLGRDGCDDVVVVEAGPSADTRHISLVVGSEAVRLWTDPARDPYFWRPWRPDGAAYGGMAGLRRRVGGRSLYWGGVLLPVDSWALLDQWPAAVRADLTRTWRGDYIGLYEHERCELARWAGQPLGGSDPVTLGATTFDRTPVAVRRHSDGSAEVFSPLSWWAPEEVGELRAEPRIVADTAVDSLALAAGGGLAVRIRRFDQQHTVRADTVVLAAGTIQNTRLALASLAAFDAPGTVGGGLVDKIAGGFRVRLPRGSVDERLVSTLRHRVSDYRLRSTQFISIRRTAEHDHLDTWVIGEQQRDDANRVLAALDAPGEATVRAALTDADARLRRAQRERLQEFWDAVCAEAGQPRSALPFLAGLAGDTDVDRRITADDERPVTYELPLGAEQHEAGTLPLGTVLTDDGELRGAPGVYVAGPASFPRTGAANPSLTTLALGRRLGALVADRVRKA